MNIILKTAIAGCLIILLLSGIRGFDPLTSVLGRQPDDVVFWVRAANGWVVVAAACVLMFPILLWRTGRSTSSTLAVGASLAIVSLMLLVPLNRAAQGLTANVVIVRPGLPWRRDVRFAITSANVRLRGCQDHGRFRPAYSVRYTVLAPTQSQEALVDLGDGVDLSNLKSWLLAMRSQPFVLTGQRAPYGFPTSDPSGTIACVRNIGRDLTGEEQSALVSLLMG